MLVYPAFDNRSLASGNSSATALMAAIFTQRCEWRKEIKIPISNIQAPEKPQAPSLNRGIRVWHLMFEASLDVGA
ncbi:MAG TPA: hypothetical protein VNN22_09445 [Verrucomicrobiae bacterium]|nr:hypothetical protein [Verrucomicrobiae bacterium]